MTAPSPSPAEDSTAPAAADLGFPDRFNFRDLGGLETADGSSVARGLLFRGASLHHFDRPELERFRRLGMRTVIDLRTPFEWGDETAPPLPDLGARSMPLFQHLPELPPEPEDAVAMMSDLYMWVLEVGAPTFTAMLELLAAAETYPMTFYCAAGKDRTGIVSALVYDLLGVPRELIVRDYALSDAPVETLRQWIAAEEPEREDPVPAGAYRAPAATMESFLDRLDERYGSVAGYLGEIGVGAEVEAALRRNLLQPSP